MKGPWSQLAALLLDRYTCHWHFLPSVLTLDGSVTTLTTHSSPLTPHAHLPSQPYHLPAAPDLHFPLTSSSKVTSKVLALAPSCSPASLLATHSASEAPGHCLGWEASLGSTPSPISSPPPSSKPTCSYLVL